jgi:signal transduction histidine kinase
MRRGFWGAPVGLRIEDKQAVWITARRAYPLPTAFLALCVATVSYLAARLGGTLVLPPYVISALWPGCALLASVLLLLPRRTWPVLIPAGLAGFVAHELQVGQQPLTIALFILGDAIEIIIVVLGLRYSFDGIPRLNSLRALAKYSFFAVLLGPFIGSLVGAFALSGNYFTTWRFFFSSEAMAFLTVIPAVLSWASPDSVQKSVSTRSQLEGAALIGTLVFLVYVIFFFYWRIPPLALPYSLVPVLLWAALRFGSKGVSTSVIVIAFSSLWGSIHGRGPFTGLDPLDYVLSLQLFWLFAAAPFMLLAVVVEEREQARLVEKELAGRLIWAQEQERTRIARELHDDIAQQLAVLAIRLANIKSGLNGTPEAKERLEEIRQHCSDIARNVQTLSHQLHNARLDSLGIVTALRVFCKEFAQQYDVSIDFKHDNVPKYLPKNASLCIFRVAQEALHNAVKHSGTKEFAMELSATTNEVQLVISDGGAGFDVEKADRDRGLGLVSMQERVQLIHGRFHVDSRPGAGTKIVASVPLVAEAAESLTDLRATSGL